MSDGAHLKVALTVCIMVVSASVLFYVQHDRDGGYRNPVNDGLTSILEFDVECPETGTSAEGTFFVMQSGSSVKVKATADLIVGATDEVGIAFFVPAELDVVDVLCSYKGATTSEHVVVRAYPYGGNYMQIPKPHMSPDGGGQGRLMMELRLKGSVKLSDVDSLDFIVEAGAAYEDVNALISH